MDALYRGEPERELWDERWLSAGPVEPFPIESIVATVEHFRRHDPGRVGLPLFVYGAAVNFLPYYLPGWLAARTSRRPTDFATIRLLASAVAFPLFWALETALVLWAADLRWALAFFLSLPLGGVARHGGEAGSGGRGRRRPERAAEDDREGRGREARRAAVPEDARPGIGARRRRAATTRS